MPPKQTVVRDPEPVGQETPAETIAPTVLSVTHFLDSGRKTEVPVGEPVFAGDDIYTVIEFSEPGTPVIAYANGREERQFTLSGRGGVHWRGLCKPLNKEGTTFICLQTAWKDTYSVTILADTADLSGNRLGEDIAAPVLEVRPRVAQPVSKEPVQPVVPEEAPEKPVVVVPPKQPQNVIVGDTTYSFTFDDGRTYPGYNPSPKLQHILDTHPSAKLPFFEEAVKQVEVINWVYKEARPLFDSDFDRWGDIIEKVLSQFELSFEINTRVRQAYGITTPSVYWLHVEYLRIRMRYPEITVQSVRLIRFKESVDNGFIVGTTNPNN